MPPIGQFRVISMVATAGMLLQPAFGQAQGGGQPSAPPAQGGGATGGGGSLPGGGGNVPGGNTGGRQPGQFPTQQNPNQDNPWGREENRPIFLSGKVAVDDGTPPPETVVIERVCNGITRPEAYTDSKGRFSFQLGQNNGMFQDASVSGPMDPGSLGIPRSGGGFGGAGVGERDLMGCELVARLPGFRSEVVSLANRRSLDSPEVGTIILHRLGNVEGRIVSSTSLNAPKDARKAFEKGQDQAKRKKPEEAYKSFQKAVEAYPRYAAAWVELGNIQAGRNQPEDARKSFEQATGADPKFIAPYLRLSLLAAREEKWQEVADYTDRAIKLDPFDYPDAYFYNAVARYNLKNLDAAEKSAREALKLDTTHRIPKAEHLLGIILAQRSDYAGAAAQLRNYLKFSPGAEDAGAVRSQLQQLDTLSKGNAPAEDDQAASKP